MEDFMELEKFVSSMMEMSVMGRLWHWSTDTAQHHVTFETFLKENEMLTDSIVESSLGYDIKINLSKVGVNGALGGEYSIENARKTISDYRSKIHGFKKELESNDENFSIELDAILDDATELCSKTLYLLRLS